MVAGEVDVLPAERRDVGQQGVGDVFTVAAQPVDRAAEVDRVPERGGGRDQGQPARAVLLQLDGAVAQLPEPVEADGAAERVAGLALAQLRRGVPPERRLLEGSVANVAGIRRDGRAGAEQEHGCRDRPAEPSRCGIVSAMSVLDGLRVRLRPPGPNDAKARLALGHDPEIVRMFGGDTGHPLPPLTAPEVASWLDGLHTHPHAWIIEHEGRLLREVRLDGLNKHDRRARLAIGFYDPAKLGIGLGRETVSLILAHAFGRLELHRVDLRVLAYNMRAIRCYQSCGFVVEGREREAALVDGVRHDDVMMGILAPEFRAKCPDIGPRQS